MTRLAVSTESLVLFAWARVWSPMVPAALFQEAWQALRLPDDPDLRDMEFCSLFHVGVPAPRVPLLLHATLNRPGDVVRMDWMRVMSHLALKPGDQVLPPDHLAICCEIFAQAVARGGEVMVHELRSRYLLPWCDVAAQRVSGEDPRFGVIVEEFRESVEAA